MTDRLSSGVDFADNANLNLVLPKAAATPSDFKAGEVFFDTVLKAPLVGIAADTAKVMARKHSAAVGDGAATSYVVTHGFNTVDVVVQVVVVATGVDSATVTSITRAANTVTVVFSGAPALNAVKVIVIG